MGAETDDVGRVGLDPGAARASPLGTCTDRASSESTDRGAITGLPHPGDALPPVVTWRSSTRPSPSSLDTMRGVWVGVWPDRGYSGGDAARRAWLGGPFSGHLPESTVFSSFAVDVVSALVQRPGVVLGKQF